MDSIFYNANITRRCAHFLTLLTIHYKYCNIVVRTDRTNKMGKFIGKVETFREGKIGLNLSAGSGRRENTI